MAEVAEETETGTETEEQEVDVETMSDEDLAKVSIEQTSTDTNENAVPEKDEENKVTEEEPETTQEKEELNYKELYEKEKESNEKQGKAFRTQSNEVGSLRKELEEQISSGNEENYNKVADEEGVFEANKRLLEANAAEKELKSLNAQESINTTRNDVLQRVPEFESKIDGILNYLSEQGISSEDVARFKAEPYTNHPFTLINLAKIADLNDKAKQLTSDNESLRKKPTKLLDDIEKAANEGVSLNPTSGTSSQETSVHLSEEDITRMSDADLDKQLKESQGG